MDYADLPAGRQSYTDEITGGSKRVARLLWFCGQLRLGKKPETWYKVQVVFSVIFCTGICLLHPSLAKRMEHERTTAESNCVNLSMLSRSDHPLLPVLPGPRSRLHTHNGHAFARQILAGGNDCGW